MFPRMIILFAIFCSLVFPFSGFVVNAAPEVDIMVQSEGYGSSKKDALLDARRSAVENGIGIVIISETEMVNFQIKKDFILTRTLGSVKKYEMLKEEELSDGTFYIKINALVSLANIKKDLAALKILLESMDKPRMMVVVWEEQGNAAESAILEYLGEKGFDLVDPAVTAALLQKNDNLIQQAAKGDVVAVAKIGVANGAEYVLIGNVTKSIMAGSVLGDTGMISGQAKMTAKVVNCSNARIITSKSATSGAVHVSKEVAQAKAAEKVAEKLMDKKLFEQIIASFQDMVNNGIPLDIIVEGVTNFSMQKAVMKRLGRLPGIVSINKRSFGSGRLVVAVVFKGNIDSFAEAADGKAVKDKKLLVVGIAGSRININME